MRGRRVSPPEVKLTRREREVIGLVLKRQSDKEIAQALGVSHLTVAWHLRNASRKLGVRTRREAARKYRQLFGNG
jgi:DNA-binding CsgD family transcriptional regulator